MVALAILLPSTAPLLCKISYVRPASNLTPEKSRCSLSRMEKLLEVLEAHRYNVEAAVCTCSDYVQVGLKCDKQTHPEHLAEMLKPLLAEVWAEGHDEALHGTDMEQNPYTKESK